MDSSKSFRYAVAGRAVIFNPVTHAIGLQFDDDVPTADRIRISEHCAALGPFPFYYEVPEERFTIYRFPQAADNISDAAPPAISRLSATPQILRTAPVFEFNNKRVMPTERLLVKCTSLSDQRKLKSFGLTVIDTLGETLICLVPQDRSPLALAADLTSLDWVHYVEPDFVTIGTPLHSIPDKRLDASSAEPSQYAVRITQADSAWELQKGDPNIRIAILDDGLDIYHEDLGPAVVATYDAMTDSALTSVNPWDSHGTRCAGIAAANHENSIGIQGVGGGCSLMAVRIAASPYRDAPWSTTSSYIRRGIDWAVSNGADVLNCSWGGSAPSNLIAEALENAVTFGRDGRGCIVVAAAGNGSGPVDFPGDLSVVLTTTGTNAYDEFKTRESQDGEYWWGSNFGPQVDIAAPAVQIHTTDISGEDGVCAGDYVENFNGTSAATPIVAGAAALVLSADNQLTERQVRQLLVENADKIDRYPYINGRNDHLGHGRLNVYRALQAIARSGNPIAGVVRQIGSGNPRAGGFYLDQNGEASYLLRMHLPDASGSADELAEQELSYLSRFAGQSVLVQYSYFQKTPYGCILWGGDLQVSSRRESGREEDIPPGEVRLADLNILYPEKDKTIPPGEVRLGWTEHPPTLILDEEIPPNEVRMGFMESES